MGGLLGVDPSGGGAGGAEFRHFFCVTTNEQMDGWIDGWVGGWVEARRSICGGD